MNMLARPAVPTNAYCLSSLNPANDFLLLRNRAPTCSGSFSAKRSLQYSMRCSNARGDNDFNPISNSSQNVYRTRRVMTGSLLSGLFVLPSISDAAAEEFGISSLSSRNADTTITDKVYIDFMLCPTIYKQDRSLGESSPFCTDGEQLGRVVIGLYGKQVPVTVSIFKAMVTGSAGSTFKGSVIHKILPGQYIQAGKQGSVEKGEIEPPKNLPRNKEAVESKSFLLGHNRPGTVSLSLGTNDDNSETRLYEDYRNVEFLITTGPGPAPQLDSGNIVFGTVIEGMDVVTRIAAVPVFKPSEELVQFNDLAEFFGDDRAQKGRAIWNRPLKSIVLVDCGLI